MENQRPISLLPKQNQKSKAQLMSLSQTQKSENSITAQNQLAEVNVLNRQSWQVLALAIRQDKLLKA